MPAKTKRRTRKVKAALTEEEQHSRVSNIWLNYFANLANHKLKKSVNCSALVFSAISL